MSSGPVNDMSAGPSGDQMNEDAPAPSLSYDDRNMLVIGLLIGLIVLLLITLLYLTAPPFLAWIRRWRRATNNDEDDERRAERRYETIEGWLISKRVLAHDKDCEKIQSKFCQSCKVPEELCSPKSVDPDASFDSVETDNTEQSSEEGEEKECPICMEPYQIGDIVSWSPNVDVLCRHVFHHECIKEWMLQSGNCPCCRDLILPIDEEGFSLERSVLKELCQKRARLAATSYYCYEDGFVCFDKKPGKCSRSLLDSVKIATSCRITPKDLVELRGHRSGAGDDSDKKTDSSADCEVPMPRPVVNSEMDSTSLIADNEMDSTALIADCEMDSTTLLLGGDQQMADQTCQADYHAQEKTTADIEEGGLQTI
mmetsp:Transcript_6754/g.8743  ORF Transcript_6754/g.8743 Transcript_6754/m.8743 type:complete len:369 (-) Transcript_6754:101-1207(-)